MSGDKGTPEGKKKPHWQQLSPGREPNSYIRYNRYGAVAATRWRNWFVYSGSSGRPKTRVHVTVQTTKEGDPQVVHVRVSPTPNVFEEGETSQDSAAEEPEKAPPPKWKLTPAEEKMQTLYNFNETALQPKSEFYPADESYSEKLKLLYEEKQVSPCCQHCSPCCSCCSCVIQ